MQCISCGVQNRESARFCEGCGATLTSLCPVCESKVSPSARFCDSCGHPLRPADAQEAAHRPPEDRRIVTVLFADLVGFTTLAEQLDAEDVHAIQSMYFDRMSEEILRFEGTIEKYAGDAILALFGAPAAHEDDPRRALRCALGMQDAMRSVAAESHARWGINLALRVGVNTGDVVSGMWDIGGRTDHAVSGDAVNVAARLQTVADPGRVAVADSTYRLARDYFVWEPMGDLTVKGRGLPVTAYRVVAARSVQDRVEATGRLTPFIGREHELHVLGTCFERALHGEGQVVVLVGEPGIGKSRVLVELHQRIPASQATWLETRCISYGKSIPYLPIVELLKRSFELDQDDADDRIIQKINDATVDWQAGAKATVPYLKYLLGVDPGDASVRSMDAMRRRAGILDGLRALVLMIVRDRPLVLAIEDLHWIDEESEKALAVLTDLIAGKPAMFILTCRPEHAPSIGERSYDSRLPLSPLAPQEGTALARAALSVDHLSAGVQLLITSKAEGNPLYIEELTRSLNEIGVLRKTNGTYTLERPTEQIDIPDTIQGLILSRIDRLEHRAKVAIQLASVLGREFTLRLLQRISDPHADLESALDDLKRVELIRETQYFPERAYSFKHALTHDVAYSTILKDRRKALHRTVASAVEVLYAERLSDQYETLAHHYLQGEDWQKGLVYSVKAAEKASEAFANVEALSFYQTALVAVEQLVSVPHDALMDIHAAMAEVFYALNRWHEGVAAYEAASRLARTIGDRHHDGLFLCGAAFGSVFAHTFERSEAMANEALALVHASDDRAVEGNALLILALVNALRGRVLAARDQAEQAKVRLQGTGETLSEGEAWGVLCLIDAWRGETEQARAEADRSVALVQQTGVTLKLVDSTWCKGLVLMAQGNYEEAISILRPLVDLCRRMGERSFQGRIVNSIGWIYGELGDWERAVELNQLGLELGMAVGDPEIIANCRANLADYALAQGDVEGARQGLEAVSAALPAAHEWMKWRYSQHVMHSLGEVVLQQGDAERALQLADQCLKLAESTELRKNIVKGRRLKGQALLALGCPNEAEQEIEAALVIARPLRNPRQLWEILAALGTLRQAQDRPKEAQEAYGQAMAEIDRVGSLLRDETLRATFLASARVTPIRNCMTA